MKAFLAGVAAAIVIAVIAAFALETTQQTAAEQFQVRENVRL